MKKNKDHRNHKTSQKSGNKHVNHSKLANTANTENKADKSRIITGIISTIQKGAGFIDDPAKESESIYIEPGHLNTALNGDTVEAKVSLKKNSKGKIEMTGEILRVIEHAKNVYVGIVDKMNGKTQIIPDDRKMYVRISILPDDAKRLIAGDKVLVSLLPWVNPKQDPIGKVIRTLGKKGNNNVEMESIILEKGFEVGFPDVVKIEAEAIGHNKAITTAEIALRRDIRGTDTFTIDPFDAKDFDDAISFKQLPDGLFEIGVHIADVSHYVREGSALDKEAVKRGCSVYLVDRTIPMLPEVLSNDVCSLNPHEDKLSFSAIFILDDKAYIRERWFGRTIMNSTHRFTYETAQAVIDGNATNVCKYSNNIQGAALAEEGMQYRESLLTLNRLAKILQKDKFSKGAIEFEQEEIKFQLDSEGKPVGVYSKERLDTHKLVEEYMLLANREVAKYIFDSIKKKGKRDTGAIYRIHETPDKEKIKNLTIFVKALGYTLKTQADGSVTAHDLNNLLDQIEDTPHESLVRTATIRSMQKAIYSTTNIGHFGLAFDFYTHFTSPIRRYPDLLVHRVLAKHINHEPFGDRDIVVFQKIAQSSTDREIRASEAERASKKLKQVEYMSTRVGQNFQGTISGVSRSGIFVEETVTKCEGMINFRNLGNDFFNLDEKTYSVIGEKTGVKYTLGDMISFKVISADLDQKQLEYGIK